MIALGADGGDNNDDMFAGVN